MGAVSDDDRAERERVYARIAPVILTFKAERPDGAFHAEELRDYVIAQMPEVAPDSPGRILRLLRQEGLLNYVVVNRRQSLYQFRPIDPPQPRPWSGPDQASLFDR
jgi:hypothetical protein